MADFIIYNYWDHKSSYNLREIEPRKKTGLDVHGKKSHKNITSSRAIFDTMAHRPNLNRQKSSPSSMLPRNFLTHRATSQKFARNAALLVASRK